MKNYPIYFLILVFTSSIWAQSDQQIARYFQQHPDADANADGILTREEAKSHRQAARRSTASQADPTEGDNLLTTPNIPGIEIPESVSPIIEVPLTSEDGIDLTFYYRTPPGNGPYPAIFFFHGGGGYSNQEKLQTDLRNGTIHTRFLDAGFTIVTDARFGRANTNSKP